MTEPALVVATDGSLASRNAVAWAARAAAARGLPLRIVHVLDDPALAYPRPLPTRENLDTVLEVRGRRILRMARETAEETAPELTPELVLRRGIVAKCLTSQSRGAAMLVLGTPGLRPLGRILLGSTSVALAAHAECPVALVRPHVGDDEPPSAGPVVVGVDGSPSSEQAVAVAFEEASWRKAPLTAVHCWDDRLLSAVFRENDWKFDGSYEQEAAEVLAERIAGWEGRYPEVEVRQVVVRGRPSEQLLDLADRAQLLVVGSRGRGGLTGLLLGSTSQAVMSYALCPVIVAREDQSGPSGSTPADR
ncbi:universal stress protein [Amycolatopsis benzoatilytica]|uniref:universal stress protein n=1 Tax=Amycolatopsis benzoatilytica TaxID=346045 RepID=UPI00035C93B7|nr:universal stress protein [Amycolatopsis benzoatilytica]